jgi:hypothetical protein
MIIAISGKNGNAFGNGEKTGIGYTDSKCFTYILNFSEKKWNSAVWLLNSFA